ncbi:hypothetical protein SO802_012489, partial [Lithocarpus litseifolius]
MFGKIEALHPSNLLNIGCTGRSIVIGFDNGMVMAIGRGVHVLMQGGACTDDEVRVYCYKVVRVKVHCILEGRFLPMSETSNYYSSTSGHLCDLDLCTLRTSLKLHTFGRRFYGYRYWSP